MAKSKNQKKELLKSYKESLKSSKCVIVVSPTKLTPNEVNDFRKSLYDLDSKFTVVKNTLFKLALQEAELPEIEGLLSGEHAVLFCTEDFVNPAKSLKDFIENTKVNKEARIKIHAGILDGNLLTAQQVEELADMPTFDVSISQVIGIIDMAMSGVVNVLEDSVRSYLSIIDQSFKE